MTICFRIAPEFGEMVFLNIHGPSSRITPGLIGNFGDSGDTQENFGNSGHEPTY